MHGGSKTMLPEKPSCMHTIYQQRVYIPNNFQQDAEKIKINLKIQKNRATASKYNYTYLIITKPKFTHGKNVGHPFT